MPAARVAQSIITVDDVSWTAVAAPIGCNYATLYNNDSAAQTLKRRLASADANTEIKIWVSGVHNPDAGCPPVGNRALDLRYTQGEIIYYLQSVSGTFPVVIDFRV